MAPERKTGSKKKAKKSMFSRRFEAKEDESSEVKAFDDEKTEPGIGEAVVVNPAGPDPAPEVSEPEPAPAAEPVRRVVLRNLRNRAVTFNLPHEVYCSGAGECFCEEQEHKRYTENVKERKEWIVKKTIRICSSVSIGPRGQSVPLHPAALECPDIRQAMRAQPTRLQAIHTAGS